MPRNRGPKSIYSFSREVKMESCYWWLMPLVHLPYLEAYHPAAGSRPLPAFFMAFANSVHTKPFFSAMGPKHSAMPLSMPFKPHM